MLFLLLYYYHCIIMLDTNLLLTNGPIAAGTTFQLAQLHFHWGSTNTVGSEHRIAGTQYALEMHLVHYNRKYPNISVAIDKSDGLAVIGVLFMVYVGVMVYTHGMRTDIQIHICVCVHVCVCVLV